MNAYCPYSNIKTDVLYPHMLVVGGMNDPRVAYFEPAKWTAKLREKACWKVKREGPDGSVSDEERMLLLRIQDAGHSGSSGQYSHLEDLAFEYSFLISVLGAQFRPVSCGGQSLNGVDYDMYWEELEKDNQQDDEDEEDEEEEEDADTLEARRPSTPLQKISEFLSRRKLTKKKSIVDAAGKKDKATKTRSPSILASGIRNLSLLRNRSLSQADPETSSLTVEPSGSAHTLDRAGDGDDVVVDHGVEAAPTVRRSTNGTSPTRSIITRTPTAAMRHPNYTQEESTGRVQSSSKLYNFLSKFF